MSTNFIITKEWDIFENNAVCMLFNRPALARYDFERSRLELVTGNLVEPIEAHPMLNVCKRYGRKIYCFPDWYDKLVVYDSIDKSIECIYVDKNSNIYEVFRNENLFYAIVTSKNYILEVNADDGKITRYSYDGTININKVGAEFANNMIYIPKEDSIEYFDCSTRVFKTVSYDKGVLGTITNIKQIEDDKFVFISGTGRIISVGKITNDKVEIEKKVDIGNCAKSFEIKDVRIIDNYIMALDWTDCRVVVVDNMLNNVISINVCTASDSEYQLSILYTQKESLGVLTGEKKVYEIIPKSLAINEIKIDCSEIDIQPLYESNILLREGDPFNLQEYVQFVLR